MIKKYFDISLSEYDTEAAMYPLATSWSETGENTVSLFRDTITMTS